MRINIKRIFYLLFFTVIIALLPLSCGQKGAAEHIKLQALPKENLPLTRADSLKSDEIKEYFSNLYSKGGFNGNVLVASHGKVIFEGCFGFADYKSKTELTPETSFQLASVAKQFTATAILILKDKGMLKLDDPVEKYITSFPYKGITIRLLLEHRSGLPNYIYFCDKYVHDKETPISNNYVISLFSMFKPNPYYEPDHKFNYSNTGYILLASIVEKVSKMSFGDFLKKEIFDPLGMANTFISNDNKTLKPNMATGYKGGWRVAQKTFLDGVVGDKGLYSSVLDLYKWDKALYTDKIVSRQTLQEAFMPNGKPLSSKKNYGFGWRMDKLPDSTRIIYHTGWWEGFQTLLVRVMKDTSTIVVLKNRKSGHIDRLGILKLLYPGSFPDKNGKEKNILPDEEEEMGPGN